MKYLYVHPPTVKKFTTRGYTDHLNFPSFIMKEVHALIDSCPSTPFKCAGSHDDKDMAIISPEMFHDYIPKHEIQKIHITGEVSPELSAIVGRHDFIRYRDYGIYAGRNLPIIYDYGWNPSYHAIIFTGSWLYGMADEESDYDLRAVVSDKSYRQYASTSGIPSRNKDIEVLGSAALSSYSMSMLGSNLMLGSRHAWELAKAPLDCRVASGVWEIIDEMSGLAEDRMPKESFLNASASYVKKWAPALTGFPVHESDVNFLRWKIERGWAYKLGYYMLIDVILAEAAYLSGTYDTRRPFEEKPELREAALRCKRGDMPFEEWRLTFERIAHKQAWEALQECLPPSSSSRATQTERQEPHLRR